MPTILSQPIKPHTIRLTLCPTKFILRNKSIQVGAIQVAKEKAWRRAEAKRVRRAGAKKKVAGGVDG